MKKRNFVLGIATTTWLVSSAFDLHGQAYIEKKDPTDPRRVIIEYKPIVRTTNTVKPVRNVLDESLPGNTRLIHQPFEMKNPASNKMLNPAEKVTIEIHGKKIMTTTVEQYFDELNKMEKAMNARGRSLKNTKTISILRPAFNRMSYTKKPSLKHGFTTGNFYSTNSGVFVQDRYYGKAFSNNQNGIKPGNGMQFAKSGGDPFAVKKIWQAKLYITKRNEDHGQPEFPAEWVTIGQPNRSTYPILVAVPTGMETQIKRIDWQVADRPFDGTSKELNPSFVKLSGTSKNIAWQNSVQGIKGTEPNVALFKYAALYVFFDRKKLFATPIKVPVKTYHIRALCYSQSGELIKITPQVRALFGEQDGKAVVLGDGNQYNSVPGFSYKFPDTGQDLPFGIFVNGKGFNSKKARSYSDAYDQTGTVTGYKLTANASIGVNHFNFLSIVDPNEPLVKPLPIIGADFRSVFGLGTGDKGENEGQGAQVTLNVLGQPLPPYGFTTPAPDLPNAITLEYELKQDLNIGLLDMWVMIGPVPLHLNSKITGKAGVRFSGSVMTQKNFGMTGAITPFLESKFEASASVDALIAYATIKADVNPLLSVNMPMQFNNNAPDPLQFHSYIEGLKGGVYLRVGFFYPCPDLEKAIGFLVGKEKTPLCECVWEYNIFDFAGFSHSISY